MAAVAPPSYEDEATLYSLATECLDAAEILIETPGTKLNVSLVTFYLLGHAAELLMKSCLYKAGVPLKELKVEVGHDLDQLVTKVQAVGLHPPLAMPHILALANNYKAKSTEYRQLKAMSFPQTDLLLQEVRALSSRVFNEVAAWPREAYPFIERTRSDLRPPRAGHGRRFPHPEPAVIPDLSYSRLVASADGGSRFDAVAIPVALQNFAPPAQPFGVSPLSPASQCGFLHLPAGWVGEMHPSPIRMWIFVLEGEMHFEASNGETRHISPGSALLLEDTVGRGHFSRVLGTRAVTLAVVRLPESNAA